MAMLLIPVWWAVTGTGGFSCAVIGSSNLYYQFGRTILPPGLVGSETMILGRHDIC